MTFPSRLAIAVISILSAALPVAAQPQRAPNELGRAMILEYHLIEAPEARWARTPQNFRRDLERLYREGFRLTGLNDYLDGKIDLPAGTTPVILTFDDSSPGQFRMIEKNGRPEVDPESAVGILEAFAREHPDFGLKATFYVLPGAKQPHKLFGQPEHERAKLEYLVKRGFEIGNHTLWHANLSKYPEGTVKNQIAMAQKWVQELVPGYRLRTLALPMGAYPKETEWAVRGTFNGVSYKNDAILMVAGGPAPSPYSRRFDRTRLPRIQAVESDLTYWFRYFVQRPGERFVSDGNASIITVLPGQRDQLRSELPAGLRVAD